MRLSYETVLAPDGARMLEVRFGQGTLTDQHRLPYDEKKLSALARSIVGVLRRGNRSRSLADEALSELRFLGEELHRALVPSALDIELGRGSGPLLLDLDEALVPIPFELMFDGRQFFCRQYALGRVVRSSVSRRGAERRALGMPPRALIVISDPKGDLPEVHVESDAIVDALEREKVRARMLGEISRDTLRRELKDFDLVHFAGHADFLSDDPSASGWHLSDGKFTAADVASLVGGRPMPLVIFSNACESGRTEGWNEEAASGDGRRAYGLASAFLYAGVRHYIGTQWEVIDGHSATFATSFYQNLGSGQAIGAAVRHARDAVIEAGGETALAWASYVLYGDPSDRPLKRANARQLSLPSARDLAARESAPWKRPSPDTMKRVGAEIAARRSDTPEPSHSTRDTDPAQRRNSTLRALLAGAAAGLTVTALVAIVLWVQRPEPSRLAILPFASAPEFTAVAARLEACLEGAIAAAGAPLIGSDQITALGKTTSLLAIDDTRVTALGAALGARWILWGALSGSPEEAELRLLDVKNGKLLRASRLPSNDTMGACAAEAMKLRSALH